MSEADSSPTTKDGLWNDLPDLVIEKIFSYLTLRDRVRASLVSKDWYKGFESPTLWKYIDIWLTAENPDKDSDKTGSVGVQEKKEETDDSDNEEYERYKDLIRVKKPGPVETSRLSFSNEKALQFVQKYGNYVKSLRLMCDPDSKTTSSAFRVKVSEFLHRLVENSSEINELLIFFSYNSDEWEEDAKKDLIDAFCEFFSCQHRIKTLILCNYLTGEEVRLLEAVVKGSGCTITNLHCLFYNNLSNDGTHQEIYCKVLGDLPNLQFLGMTYDSVNNETIAVLNKCRKLKTVYLYNFVDARDVLWRPVPSDAAPDWKKPLKIYPEIEDDHKIDEEHWLKCPKLNNYVSLKMSYYFKIVSKFSDANFCISCLETLREDYHKNLVSLSIVDNYNFYANKLLEKVVVEVIPAFTELRELRLELYDSLLLLRHICRLQMQKKIDLHVLVFRCLDSGVTDVEKFRAITKYYRKYIASPDWVVQIRRISYKLASDGR